MSNRNIKVACRSNNGAEIEHEVVDRAEAERIAKSLRTAANHMVFIVIDGRREKRWDRNKVVGENRWRSVDVNAFETVGPIREVSVRR